MRVIKEKNPQANIVAVDYDSSASKVNQQNRIKLMLANARLMEQQNAQPPKEVRVYREKPQPADTAKKELPLAAVDPLEEEEQLAVQNG